MVTVTAASSGTDSSNGIGLYVEVVTGALPAGSQPGTSLGSLSITTPQSSITPGHNGSWVYGAILNGTVAVAFSSIDANTTFNQNVPDATHSVTYGSFRSTAGTTTSPTTYGAAAPSESAGSLALAMAEIVAATTLAKDASTPAAVSTTAAKTISTASFNPPPGSLLVATVTSNADGTGSAVSITVTSPGLGWVQVAACPATPVGPLATVWIANAPRVTAGSGIARTSGSGARQASPRAAGSGIAKTSGSGRGQVTSLFKRGAAMTRSAGSVTADRAVRSIRGSGLAQTSGSGSEWHPGPKTIQVGGSAMARGTGQGGYGRGKILMGDSLVLGDIELLGYGMPSTNPMCEGVIFRLLPGYDMSAPQPSTEIITSLLLDGELQTGRRASNRLIKLPVWVIAPSRDLLAAGREHLQQVIDESLWPMTWTRDRGIATPLPLVFDCQRAAATEPEYDLKKEKQLGARVLLTIPAFPYGRSATQEQIRFDSPAPSGPPPPPPPVTIDNYEAISSPQASQSSRCVVGPHSCCWDPDDPRVGDPGGENTYFSYSTVLPNSLDFTGMSSVSAWLGFGSRWYHKLPYVGHHSGVRVTLTLTDTDQHTISMQRSHLRLPVSPQPNTPTFREVTMLLPPDDGVFEWTSVAGYTLTVANYFHEEKIRLRYVTLYVDALTAYPDSQTVLPVTRGAVYTLRGIKGTARAPLSASFTQPPTAGSPTVVTTTGVGNYVVPAGTVWLKVEGTGGGAPGSSRTTAGLGAGGPGAEYAREDVFQVTGTGEVIPYSVGAGGTPGVDGTDTTFGPGAASPMVLTAHGALAPPANSTSGGTPGDGSANSVHFPGGMGRAATGSYGGGGGSSGGNTGPGLVPQGTTSTQWTAATSTNWTATYTGLVYVETWGAAGGSGTGYNNGNGQGGSGGEYAAGWVPVTKNSSYPLVVGAGGQGGRGQQQNGNNGGNSSFTGDSGVQILAHGGLRGLATGSSGPGPAGGTGSTAPVHFPGGAGGSAMPYGGGGGSSASPSGPGNPGDGYGHGGSAPPDGGGGGNGSGAGGNPGGNGTSPGGGGGGTWSNGTGGDGAPGKVRITVPGGTPDQHGAPAVAGGGAGGDGGVATNSTGSAGSQPGGGGGGANSGGTAEAAGKGGDGKLIITPFASQPFKVLVVHRPPRGSSRLYQPLTSVGAGADVPDGSHWYTVPQPVTNTNAQFSGTYTCYLAASSLNGSSQRTVTVTVRQTEFTGGPTYTQATIPVTFTPSMLSNGLLCAGIITLPVKQVPADNTQAKFDISVTDTNTADRWYDCFLLDSMGQTVIINEPSNGYVTYQIDSPDPNRGLGQITGTQTDRTAAVSVMDALGLSGVSLSVEPADGENILFAYCAGGLAPAISLRYWPFWWFDRTS